MRLDAVLPWTRVGTTAAPATVRCADVLAAPGDPLASWRAATHRQLEARHGCPVGAHVSAAFVLQWWCEAVATPLAYAAELGPWVLRGAAGLGFDLAPALYPGRIVLLPALSVEAVEADEERSERARAAYGEVVDGVVARYAPEVKMSSLQRWGVVEDVWATSRLRARAAAGRDPGPLPRRVSCCFIYSLPGLRACVACPRGDQT